MSSDALKHSKLVNHGISVRSKLLVILDRRSLVVIRFLLFFTEELLNGCLCFINHASLFSNSNLFESILALRNEPNDAETNT